jgi:catechol 2,3-dioxygenase-like lactoylglutathione lyase family enzyme
MKLLQFVIKSFPTKKSFSFVLCFLLIVSSFLNAQEIERPKILGIAHVSFKVSDISKAREFYGDLLGYEEAFTYYNKDGSIWISFFKINDRQYIEITPNLKPDQGDRLNHYCLETDNLQMMRKYLKSKGIKVPDSLHVGHDRNLHLTIPDPDGHPVEFVQVVPGSDHSNAKGKFLYDKRISDRIYHVGITVKDVDAANKFYKDILGFSEIWRGGVNDSIISWINMRIPESTDYIEYMLVGNDVTPSRLHSAHHFCLLVPDMQKALEKLRDRNKGFEIALPRIGHNKKWQLNLFDPDGTRIELMEPFTFK